METISAKKDSYLPVSLGFAMGGVFFILVLGFQIIGPTHISWLMNEIDWAQHFLGWHFFRNEAWHFPLGRITSIVHPVGASVGYTDSIPLLALIFKPLTRILPHHFQYFGLWLLLCFCLQGVFAALLMRTVSSHLFIQLLGTAFFVVSPILTARIGHPALCCHWLLLAGLWLYFRPWKSLSLFTPWSGWAIIAALGAAVHPFMAVMTLGLASAFYLRLWAVDRNLRLKYVLLSLSVLILLVVFVWWIAGYFEIGPLGQSYGTFGYGYFSMNLASPVNPIGWSGGIWGGRASAFLKAWPEATKGQAEGFNYLGMGVIILGLGAVLTLMKRPLKFAAIKSLWPLAFIFLCFTLLALSHRITFADHTLVELKLNRYLLGALSPFRSSGRFFWPVYYGLLFLILAFLVRRYKPLLGIVILVFGLAIQLFDFHKMYGAYGRVRQPNKEWNNPLQSEIWQQIGARYKKIILVPPRVCEQEPSAPYEPFAYFAANHHMKINSFYLARYSYGASSRYCRKLISDVKQGMIDSEAVYILNREYLGIMKTEASVPVVCKTVDGFHVCLPQREDISPSQIMK